MLTITPTDSTRFPTPEPNKSPMGRANLAPSLRLSGDNPMGSVAHVSRALEQTQRRLDNLRSLIDRFDLDDNDDGPRAA
ncbi:MAG: hypothetical protein KIT54_02505 [Phycisphaeraceae bacterium]|nr:hypothetical protein [Phycisphaeraceae bacterium]